MRFAGVGGMNPVQKNAVRCSFRLRARGRDRRGIADWTRRRSKDAETTARHASIEPAEESGATAAHAPCTAFGLTRRHRTSDSIRAPAVSYD